MEKFKIVRSTAILLAVASLVSVGCGDAIATPVGAGGAAGTAGRDGGITCVPGSTEQCVCTSGDTGARDCALDGSGYGTCACAPTPVADSVQRFVITDACIDGYGFQVRFFDETAGVMWPAMGDPFSAADGGSVDEVFPCAAGSIFCFGAGAAQNPQTMTSQNWGVGLSNYGYHGIQGPSCTVCGGAAYQVTLSCFAS